MALERGGRCTGVGTGRLGFSPVQRGYTCNVLLGWVCAFAVIAAPRESCSSLYVDRVDPWVNYAGYAGACTGAIPLRRPCI